MKTHLTLLFLIGFVWHAHTQTQKVNINASFDGTRCNGAHGLCVVEPSTSKNTTNAQVYLNEKGNLVLEVFQNKLSSKDLVRVLGETYRTNKSFYRFTMDDTFILPDDIRKLLKLPDALGELPKGTYPAEVRNGVIQIIIDIR